jgi:hypothetical protein
MKIPTGVCGLLLLAMMAPASAQTAAKPSTAGQAQANAPQADEFARIRDDLNKLESLNLNMSSEIEFLRDQNLQILLRTNSQMWTLLIRDLRQQIEREEQRSGTSPNYHR